MISICSRAVERKREPTGGPDCPDVEASPAILAIHRASSVGRNPDDVVANPGSVFYENPD